MTALELIRRRVIVHGDVQGVGFRQTCRREAAARGASGWVKNRSDGSVEAVFEGSESVVGAMVTWCRAGPPWATVTDVEVTEEPPQGETRFRIA